MPRLILATAEGLHAIELRPINGLGRHPNNSIQLLDKIVSKEHCILEQRETGFVLRDLGSLNGTYVNGRRVRGEIPLERGDEIALGSTRMRYYDDTAPGTDLDPVEACGDLPISPGSVQGVQLAPRGGAGFQKGRPNEAGAFSDTMQLPWSALQLTRDSKSTANEEQSSETGSFAAGMLILRRRIRRLDLERGAFGDAITAIARLTEDDPDMALAKCRQTLERVLTAVFRQRRDPGTRPLEQLIKELQREQVLPRKIVALCEVIRELGNVGAHAVHDDETVTYREALIAFNALTLVLDWYGRSSEQPK